MPVYFQFSNEDKWILDPSFGVAEKLEVIKVWQDTNLKYEFSFHEGHEGFPVYVCKRSERGQRDMPKIFIEGKEFSELIFHHSNKLTNKQVEDVWRVLKSNLGVFTILAKKYYRGPESKVKKPEQKPKFTCRFCEKGVVDWKLKGKKNFCPHCDTQN